MTIIQTKQVINNHLLIFSVEESKRCEFKHYRIYYKDALVKFTMHRSAPLNSVYQRYMDRSPFTKGKIHLTVKKLLQTYLEGSRIVRCVHPSTVLAYKKRKPV